MPDWRAEVRKRLSRLNLEPAHEAEIVEELAQHLDDVYQRSLKSGATEADAKSAALNELATDPLSLAEYDAFILQSLKEPHDLPSSETESTQPDDDEPATRSDGRRRGE